jgi:hypothetical protein
VKVRQIHSSGPNWNRDSHALLNAASMPKRSTAATTYSPGVSLNFQPYAEASASSTAT